MKKILLFILFILASQVVVAQWAQCSNGQYRGKILSLHTSSTSLFANTDYAGLFRSDDGGAHWPGHSWPSKSALAATGTTILVMDMKDGIGRLLRSTDNGEHWANAWPDSLASNSIGTIAASTSTFFVCTDGGIFRSKDNGLTWENVTQGLRNIYITALTASGTTLYSGMNSYTYGHGIFKSTNNGFSWLRINKDSLDITSIAATGTTIFAAHSKGILRSTDNGKSWQRAHTGMTDTNITTIVSSGTDLFATSYSGILYRSTDNGEHWAAVNAKMSTSYYNVLSLAAIGSTVFAGTDNGHIVRSTNTGEHWEDVSKGIEYQNVRSLTTNSTGVFAGTEMDGVIRSADNGGSWKQVNTGINHQRIDQFATSDNYVYAIGKDYWQSISSRRSSADVFRSADNGSTWAPIGNAQFSYNFQATTTALYTWSGDTVFRSTDHGTSWIPSKIGLAKAAIHYFKAIGSTLFAASSKDSVYRSTDNGATWSVLRIGTPSRNIWSLTPIDTTIFAVTDQGGMFRSNDNGATWTEVSTLLPKTYAYTITVNGATLFAYSGDRTTYRSSDLGDHWSLVRYDTTTLICQNIFVNSKGIFLQTMDNTMYRSGDNGLTWKDITTTQLKPFLTIVELGSVLYAQHNEGILRSTDNGDNWTEVFEGITNGQVATLAASDSILLVGTVSDGLYRSSDKGNTWQQVTPGLLMRTYPQIYCISAIGANLYAGTQANGYDIGGSLYKSTDNGEIWNVAHKGLYSNGYVSCMAERDTLLFAGMVLYSTGPAIGAIFSSSNVGKSWDEISKGIDLQNTRIASVGGLAVKDNSLYAGLHTFTRGVYRTDNDGYSWNKKSKGLIDNPNYIYIKCLAVSGTSIFAGTDNGIYRSTDNGENWEQTNTGLSDTNILCLTVSGSAVFAGTSRGGIFRSTDNGDSWIPKNTTLIVTPVNALAVRGTTIFAATQGEGIFRAQVTDFAPTDVEEQPASPSSSLRLSPMPISGDYLTISNIPASASELHIYSLLGEIVHSEVLNGAERRQITVSGLPAGVYYLRVGMETRMIIKQ
jgi:photosystem II stability/assembly factor-like uncharacterized protein